MSSMKTPLGIFWDIENIPIPTTKSVSAVTKRIRDFIADTHPSSGFAKEFVIACDVRRLADKVSNSLNNTGVFIAHVDGCAKNAADDKLQELMDVFVDKYSSDVNHFLLVVITSDINFVKPILNARRKDGYVLLIHNKNCSDDLKSIVNECHMFDEVIIRAIDGHISAGSGGSSGGVSSSGDNNIAKNDNQVKSGLYLYFFFFVNHLISIYLFIFHFHVIND
jgi:hypothetical protein